jgi:ATP-dependent helicase/nuclease subunit A
MRPEQHLADAAARDRALDSGTSFIVQAAAGSGKTTLLTQRFLALLAQAQEPEEILAITFTRKAAAEMRGRIAAALAGAASGATPKHGAEARSFALGRVALARAAERGWSLTDHPSRLHIETIDALAQRLAQRLPVLSRAGAALTVQVPAESLYRAAARRSLAMLEEESLPAARALETVLVHLDNDAQRLEALLAAMLERRDHWLPLLARGAADGQALRQRLEGSLASLVAGTLESVSMRLTNVQRARLIALAVPAARRLPEPSALAAVIDFPAAQAGLLPVWKALASLCLTQEGSFRRTLNKKNGFPPEFRPERLACESLLQELRDVPGLETAFAAVLNLPEAHYTDAQWQVLESLTELLIGAAAELELVFASEGRVDFVAVSSAAKEALGEAENPSDLALVLDHQIRHILVDEFQDTSIPQVELIERLTAGWEPEDGRTLFLVGDPMQSIYRFRAADVALFLKVRDLGLAGRHLEPLTLQTNFRSDAALVDWVNRVFGTVLPERDDLARGAVRYAPAVALPQRIPGARVTSHPVLSAEPSEEGARVLATVRALRERHPSDSIAVLARSRRQLAPAAAALDGAGIAYQGVDLVPLGQELVVQDLTSLTRALCHAGDRIAWLACLRAPWAGLTLSELHALVADAPHASVADLALEETRRRRLSDEARARLDRVLAVLERGAAQRGRRTLAETVLAAWHDLGGPATCRGVQDLANAERYLEQLASAERAGDLDEPLELAELLERLYAASPPEATDRLQLLTLYKAKGLEWDHVVLLGLGRRPGNEEPRLMRWLEFERPAQEPGLVLAPLPAKSLGAEPIEAFLKLLEKERAEYELGRLLYVGATRAKCELHLVGQLVEDPPEEGAEDDGPREGPDVAAEPCEVRAPARGTALRALWPAIGAEFCASRTAAIPAAAATKPTAVLRRLAAGWQAPAAQERLPRGARARAVTPRPEFDWAATPARHAGTVVHEELAQLGLTGEPDASAERRWRRRLAELGVSGDAMTRALQRVRTALEHTRQDPRGRWIFDAGHRDARAELAVTGLLGESVERIVIDRSFIDDEGTRWIIDFKTSSHEGADTDAFLDEERRRYRPQLERYAALLRLYDDARPIRLGLYFPLLGGWRDWLPGAVV